MVLNFCKKAIIYFLTHYMYFIFGQENSFHQAKKRIPKMKKPSFNCALLPGFPFFSNFSYSQSLSANQENINSGDINKFISKLKNKAEDFGFLITF